MIHDVKNLLWCKLLYHKQCVYWSLLLSCVEVIVPSMRLDQSCRCPHLEFGHGKVSQSNSQSVSQSVGCFPQERKAEASAESIKQSVSWLFSSTWVQNGKWRPWQSQSISQLAVVVLTLSPEQKAAVLAGPVNQSVSQLAVACCPHLESRAESGGLCRVGLSGRLLDLSRGFVDALQLRLHAVKEKKSKIWIGRKRCSQILL